MTKKSADINYISKDLFPKTYNRTMTDDDYIKQLEQENKQLKEVIDNIAKCFSDGHFEDGCDCLIIEKYIDKCLKEVSE